MDRAFEGTIIGVLRYGEPYDPAHPLKSLNWLWLTESQFQSLMSEDNGWLWIGDYVLRAKDIYVARPFTYDELKKESYYWTPQGYLLSQLEKEQARLPIAKPQKEITDGEA